MEWMEYKQSKKLAKKIVWPEVLTGQESWTSSPASATNSSTSAAKKNKNWYETIAMTI